MTTSAWAGGLAREIIRASTPEARIGGVAREVLLAESGHLHAGALRREVIRAGTGSLSVSGVRREVLLIDAPAPAMRKPWIWLRVVTAPEEFDGDPQQPWQPQHRVGLFAPAARLRPYLLINS
jgi:hypothetical protein